jgi:sensor domain CHASE-containing protein
MKIRAKVVALLAAVFVALTFVEWVVGQAFLLPRFEEIELEAARTAMKRIDYGVRQSLNEIRVSATDWGNWKDSYEFMRDRNPQFEQDNLSDAAMKQLRLTALAFVDLDGNLVLSRSFDPDSGAMLPLDLFPQPMLPDNFAWRKNLETGLPDQGLIPTEQGVLLASVAPILDGFGQGPSRGMVLMGRLLTDAEVAEIGSRAQTSVRLAAVRGDLGAEAVLRLTGETLASEHIEVKGETIEVLRVFSDVYGIPAMALRVQIPRTISDGAATTVNYVLAFTVGAAIVALLIVLVSLERTVLAPLARVTRHAVRIGSGDDLTKRLEIRRNDEIGALATEFDRMVAKVAESRRLLIDHSFHAGMSENSRGVLHNIGNAITPLRVRLAGLQTRLRAAPTADVERALGERGAVTAGSPRQADLDEFLRLASGEMADVINHANGDVEVITRQAEIVQSALTEQSRSSRTSTVIEDVQLPSIIEQSLEIVPDHCRALVSVTLDPSVQSIGTVKLARTSLRQVIQNFIINAAEAVRAAGRDHGTVRFSARLSRDDDPNKLFLDCTDTGVGIPAENLERIFEKGYSTKLEVGNMGIGLHWCATTINALGGRIWATSDGRDRGATLHVVIPVPAPAAEASNQAA